MVLKNFAFMSALSIFRSAVQLGINVLLAFFVLPSQYGLVAFSIPFTTLISMFTDLGMSSALVRMEQLDRKTAGAALTLLTAVGAMLSGLVFLVAPFISRGANMPGLSGVMIGMITGAFMSIVAIAPRAMLERKLQYHKIAVTELASIMTAAAIAIVSMVEGAGVWAIIILSITNNALRSLVFIILTRASFSVSFEWRLCVGMIKFGRWILLSNLVTFLARNFDNLLIGGVLGAASVGLYGLAYQFMLIPLIAITWPASGVLLATLSQGRYNAHQREEIILATVGMTATITFPAMICLVLIFPEMARHMLSLKWQGIGVILAWLAPLGALQSVSAYNGAILQAAGMARAQFTYSVLNTIVVMLFCIIGIQWGLMGMVKAVTLSGAILSFGFIALMVQVAGPHWARFIMALLPAVCSSLIAIIFSTVFSVWSAWVPDAYLVLVAGLICTVLMTNCLFLRRFKLWSAILASRHKQPEPAF